MRKSATDGQWLPSSTRIAEGRVSVRFGWKADLSWVAIPLTKLRHKLRGKVAERRPFSPRGKRLRRVLPMETSCFFIVSFPMTALAISAFFTSSRRKTTTLRLHWWAAGATARWNFGSLPAK